jgi:hypothetical protein
MPAKYVYDHPEGTGLGQHHATGDLASRPAQPPEATAAIRATLDAIDPTPEQRARMDAHLGASMADLDMAHGTEVEHVETTEDGTVIVSWTDQLGNARATSVTPELFASHFRDPS